MTPQQISEVRQAFEALRSNLDKRRPCVLLVEDDDADRRMLENAIKAFNLKLVSTRTAKGAIQELKDHTYDVALVDLRLEVDSGLDVIRAAKQSEIKTLFVVLTGLDENSPMIKEALDSGAAFIIQKPITREHLNLMFGSL